MQGLATLLPVLWSAIVGIVVGAGVALVVAALTDVVDVMVVHPVTMAVVLPLIALLARLMVVRTSGP